MTQSYRDTGHPCICVRGSCMSVQDPAFRASQPVGFSGQLGKEQTHANADDIFSRHGVGFGQPDSTPHPGTCSVGAELPQDFIRQDGGPTETLSEAPGAYGCSCGEVPPGLLHMRPLQHWLHGRVPRWAWKRGTHRVQITPACRKTFSPWSDPSFLQAGVPLEQVSRHAVVFTDASATGWGGHVQRAHSVRGLDGSPTALAYQLPRAAGSTPGLEPPQRAPSRQGRSGPYGQHCDRCVYQPARQFMLPSHVATRAPPPPLESEASEVPSCHPHPRSVQPGGRRAVSSSTSWGVETPSPGGPADWSWFGAAQVDLVASPETTHCQWFYTLTEAMLGTDALAHSWPWGLRKYAFSPVSLLAQTLCKIREDEEQVLLVAPYWPNRTWFPELMLLATAPPWPIPLRKDLLFQRRGTLWHPRPDLWKLHVWSLDGTRRF